MQPTRVLALIFSLTILQGCQTTKPTCVIKHGQDSRIADLQRQKEITLCEIQLRQAELDRITTAVNARGAIGAGGERLGRKAEADLTGKITQLRAKARDLDFQMAATALANFEILLSEAKLAFQQHSEILKDPKNSAAQVGLMATYLRAVTGCNSTGEHITKTAWQAAEAACSCLAEIKPRFGPDGSMNGATISQDQATQMLGAMRDNVKAAFNTYQQLKKSVDSQMQADMDAAGLGGSQTPKTPASAGTTLNEDAYPEAK